MKWLVICGIGAAVLILFAVLIGGWIVGISNTEVQQANLVKAKQVSNKNWLDECNKTIANAAEVTDAQRQALVDIIVGNSQARAEGQGKGSLAAMVKEAVPNVDVSTFNNLMNIIESKRVGFKRVQDELIDVNRAHDNTLDMFPSSFVCSILGRKKIDIVVVTSTRTENAFATGKDDDTGLGLKRK